MKNIAFCICSLLLISGLHAQNLVPNWSFEDTIHCPTGPFYGISCTKNWHSPTPNTPDYYNSCSPWWNVPGNFSFFQYAKHGQAYTGIFMWALSSNKNKEYIQVHLLDTLVKNKWYCGGFWLCNVEEHKYAVRNAGMYVSKDQVGSPVVTYLEYSPQISYNSPQFLTDTVNWVLISGSFQAQGGEKYLTIGNFNHITDSLLWDNASVYDISYYFIDAVFLYDCSESVQAYAGEDASICGEESAQLGSNPINGCHYKWTPSTGLNNDTLANPIAHPAQTTTYTLTMTDPYYQVTTDEVVVIGTDDCLKIDNIPNIFTPNGDGFNEMFMVKGQNIEKLKLIIYNRWGSKVFEGNDPQAAWDGKYNKQPCAEGVYYYVADVTFIGGKTESRKGSVTLMR